jgi:hypothetical protein
MKNTSVKNALKAFLAIALFSVGFAKAAAHVDPSHQNKTMNSLGTIYPTPPTKDH